MINSTLKMLKNLLGDERGLTAVEYAVLGGIIVAAIGLASASFQGNLTTAFNNMFGEESGGGEG